MKVKFLGLIFLSIPLMSLSSPVYENLQEDNAGYSEAKNQAKQIYDQKSQALSSCQSECRQSNPTYNNTQCDTLMCSSQKRAYNEAKNKFDAFDANINIGSKVGRESGINQAESNWERCQSQCRMRSDKPSVEYCRDVVCKKNKDNYEALQAHSKNMDENLENYEDNQNNPDRQVAEGTGEAVVNQVRDKRDDVGALSFIAAGTTGFLTMKCISCSSQCGCGIGSCGCCPQAGMYCAMAGMAAIQTAKMFKKRKDLNQTCRDLSSNGVCSVDSPRDGGQPPDALNPPDPLPPGCEYDFSLCEESTYTPTRPCPPGDSSCSDSYIGKGPGLPNFDDSDNPNNPIIGTLATKFKSEVGPGAKNPFLTDQPFEYSNLTDEQKEQLNAGMKGFNQRKKNYMAQRGLSGDTSLESGTGIGFSDSDETGKEGEDLLAENFFDDEIDLSAGFPTTKDPSGSLTGNSGRVGGSSGRRRVRGRDPASTIDKMKAMLKKMSGGDANGKGLGKKSVSIGNDSVGVREDNIFLMVHRMNRKLDEQEKRFIVDF